MLKGPELGRALKEAMRLNGARNIDVANHFKIKPPSVIDWKKYGRIGKEHIDGLILYFSDVVGPEHWGIETLGFDNKNRGKQNAIAPDSQQLSEQLQALVSEAIAAEEAGMSPAEFSVVTDQFRRFLLIRRDAQSSGQQTKALRGPHGQRRRIAETTGQRGTTKIGSKKAKPGHD